MSAADASNQAVPARCAFAIARVGALLAIAPIEIAVLDSMYDVRAVAGGAPTLLWLGVNLAIKTGAYALLYSFAAFAPMAWPQRRAIVSQWGEASTGPHAWGVWTALNVATFALLIAATSFMHAVGAPWAAFTAWLAGVGLMLALLAPAIAPISFWRTFISAQARCIGVALLMGVAVAFAALMSQNSWEVLAGVTLRASYALLQAFDATAYMDAPAKVLGAGDFHVLINSYCSGYEGVGLVLAALGVYVYTFRAQLRFPNVLVLFPAGSLAILALNVVRIAMLVEIGKDSPDFATKGFHSQAGWIAFVAVTGAMMALAHQHRWFRVKPEAPANESARDPSVHLAVALLAPFVVLMAARIAGAMAGENAHWLPVFAALLPAAALFHFRTPLRAQLEPLTWEPVAIGLAVGTLWIATQPASDDVGAGWWLMAQAPSAAIAWVALRLIGFVLIVPIAEELVFRGYLHRVLVSRRFDEAQPAQFGWAAFIVTSLLFGAMHGRWLAGALAGAAFAFALYRSKSLTGPTVAHATANGVIALWAIAMRDWALL